MPSNFPVNPEENAFPEILGGDQEKQIEAMRVVPADAGRRDGGDRTYARQPSRAAGSAGR